MSELDVSLRMKASIALANLRYARNKQLPNAVALQSEYGEFELDAEMQQAVAQALQPILARRINALEER